MTLTVKRSVTLDVDVDAELTKRFGEGSRSRFLNQAARDLLLRVRMLEVLDRMDAQHGEPSPEVEREVAALRRPS